MAPKPVAKGKSEENFRARRLSVSDIDTSEFEKANSSTPNQAAGGQRRRRMSMSPEMGVVKQKKDLQFPLEVVGTYSCHGVEPGMRQGETSAKINQDRGCVVFPYGDKPELNGKYDQALFCVYDGHGALGDKVSHYTMNNVQELLEKKLQALTPEQYEQVPDKETVNDACPTAKAISDAFIEVDNNLLKDKAIDAELSGTTAVVVLLRYEKDVKDGKVTVHCWSACCGDSRAVLWQVGNDTKDLTEDQKPDTPSEAARIKSKGGFISPPEEEWGGPARVWLDANMTLPGLAMARSIGDHLVASVGVYAEPEVRYFKWEVMANEQGEAGPAFLVMASDGVWEFISSSQATQLVKKFLYEQKDGQGPDATLAVTKLIETAAAKWRQEEGDYRDDITAIVVRLRGLFDKAARD